METETDFSKSIDFATSELPGIIETMGIVYVFEKCFERCESGGKTKEDAAIFAHRWFLKAMEGYLQ